MDTPSAFLIAVVAIFANGALLLMMRSQLAADTLIAARSWLAGTIMIGVGLCLFLYPAVLPSAVELVVPNSLILSGLFCYTAALRQFYSLPASYRLLPLVVGFVAICIYFFQWVVPDFKVRVLVVSLVWLAVLGHGFHILHRHHSAKRSPAEAALYWLYAMMVVGVAVRLAYYMGASIPVTFRITDNADWMNRLTPTLAILLPTIGTSAFMLMCYHRQYHQVRQQALTDTLTGLGNRALLTLLATPASPQGEELEPRPYGAVLLMDLDGFKAINDTYGHAAGDEVLVEVSRRLRKLVRPQDIVLRLGGDEFAIVVDGHLSATAARRLAERVQGAIAGRYESSASLPLELGASVGLALAGEVLPPGAELPRGLDELIELADRAMYDAKRDGGGYRIIGIGQA